MPIGNNLNYLFKVFNHLNFKMNVAPTSFRVATMAGIAGKAGKSAFFIILAGKAGKSCLYTSCTGWKSWKKIL